MIPWKLIPACGVLLATGYTASAHAVLHVTNQLQDAAAFETAIDNFAVNSRDLDEIAITPSGQWVIVASGSEVTPAEVIFSTGFSSLVIQKIFEFLAQGKQIDVIAFTPTEAWAVIAENLYYLSPGVPDAATLQDQIDGRIGAGQRINELAFTANNAGWALISGSFAYMVGVPSKLYNSVYDRRFSHRSIQGISIGQGGRWVMHADQWSPSNNLDSTLLSGLSDWQINERRINHLRLGPGNDFVMYSHGALSPNLRSPIERIEYGLQAGATNIFRRMVEAKVPSVSFAVIDQNQVAYARAYGVLQANTQSATLASSPFDVASLSKYVAALGTMRLAQEGLLTLATDARTLALQGGATNQLYLWKGFGEGSPQTFGIDPPVNLPQGLTLRRLLSHTASMEPWSSTGIRVSNWPNTNPALFQLLLGLDCGNGGCGFTNVVWYNPDFGPPGTAYNYSGGGFLVAQAVDEHVTGQPFSQIQQQRVFDPLLMSDTRYVLEPPDAAFEAIAAKQHDGNGNVLERGIFPWAAAGGLYTSPRDYAKAMIPLMNLGMTAGNSAFLQPFSVLLMLLDATPDSSNYGLGLGLSQSIVTEVSGTFAHSGSHSGRAYAYMEGSPSLNQGIMIVVNTESTAARTLVSEIGQAFRCAYGWSTSGCL